MKDVTIQVVKADEGGYRLIVVDDAKGEDNAEGWKSHSTESKPPTKDKMLAEVNTILKAIE